MKSFTEKEMILHGWRRINNGGTSSSYSKTVGAVTFTLQAFGECSAPLSMLEACTLYLDKAESETGLVKFDRLTAYQALELTDKAQPHD